ncbi:hypothetical protein Cob_v000487 [Colletotrichum orbiculare MAFF 240422]|uniref:Uncharacterized protein n=1 Tax=Colletotrichum orbiculare (strain 104-T / ATCC 96160 / CBS 514.97 / LARS 414 / MAFF 240422) TaxID=1213857 RepID=A0A484GA40_COLOR|nr:hypothetical protein Cob_v000487 [Colletotrichum orbiculare MAFF 240422]
MNVQSVCSVPVTPIAPIAGRDAARCEQHCSLDDFSCCPNIRVAAAFSVFSRAFYAQYSPSCTSWPRISSHVQSLNIDRGYDFSKTFNFIITIIIIISIAFAIASTTTTTITTTPNSNRYPSRPAQSTAIHSSPTTSTPAR